MSYIAGALGVCVAAFYYMMMVRINQRAVRINMTNNIMQSFISEEAQRRWFELLNMKWSDYDDFERKYGSDSNLDNAAKRQAVFYFFEILGNQLRNGYVDRETIYNTTNIGVSWTWAKFKPVIEENRRRYSGEDAMKGFEYLAGEMLRMKVERDPSYRIPENFAEYVPDK